MERRFLEIQTHERFERMLFIWTKQNPLCRATIRHLKITRRKMMKKMRWKAYSYFSLKNKFLFYVFESCFKMLAVIQIVPDFQFLESFAYPYPFQSNNTHQKQSLYAHAYTHTHTHTHIPWPNKRNTQEKKKITCYIFINNKI